MWADSYIQSISMLATVGLRAANFSLRSSQVIHIFLIVLELASVFFPGHVNIPQGGIVCGTIQK